MPRLCSAAAGPAEQYSTRNSEWFDHRTPSREAIADIADEAALRLLAGGKIDLVGEIGMTAEFAGRAGGLACARMLGLKKGPRRSVPTTSCC